MPAAAVIPAPIAYIKVVAVKKLVVELLAVQRRCGNVPAQPGHPREEAPVVYSAGCGPASFTVRKFKCLKQA